MPPVIPGGYGYGMDTRAAYGSVGVDPIVYRVTSLSDANTPGTLRYGVETLTVPRVVVFEVSGYIDMASNIYVTAPYLTVAGQTAPSPGITLRMTSGVSDGLIQINTHDVLIQHLRIRPGASTCNSAILAYGYTSRDHFNIVLDHLSVSWAQDEQIYSGPTDVNSGHSNFTVWRCLVAEGLWAAPGSSGCGGGGLANGHNIFFEGSHQDVLQSVMSTSRERNPMLVGGGAWRLLNNIIYSWQGEWGVFVFNKDVLPGPWFLTSVGNRFIVGPESDNPGVGGAVAFWYGEAYPDVSAEDAGNQSYRDDNTVDNSFGTTIFDTNRGHGFAELSYDPDVGTAPTLAPLPTGYTPIASTALEAYLLDQVGARPLDRDAVDTRIIADIAGRTGGFISDESDVGGYPALAATTWTLSTPSNPHTVLGSGYTNLEVWLQGFANALEGAATTVTGTGGVVFGHPAIASAGASATPNDPCGAIIWSDDFGGGSTLANYSAVNNVSISTGMLRPTGTSSQQYYSQVAFTPAVRPVGGVGCATVTTDHSAAADNRYGNSLFEVRDGPYVLSLYHGVGTGTDRSVLELYTAAGGYWASSTGVITPGTPQTIHLQWQWSSYDAGHFPQLDGAITVTVDGVPVFAITGIALTTPAAQTHANTKAVGVGTSADETTWTDIYLGPMGNGDNFVLQAGLLPSAPVTGIGPIIEFKLQGVWTDVTNDVLTREPIVAFSGRRSAGPTTVVPEPGSLTFALDNSALNSAHTPAYYSPYHTACRAGFGLRTPVRMTLNSPAYPSGHITWVGRIVTISVDPGVRGERGVRITAADVIGNLGESPCPELPFAVRQQANDLVYDVIITLADPDIVSGLYGVSLDSTPSSVFATAFDSVPDNASALEELNRIVMSERGRLYMFVGGILGFRTRQEIELPIPVTARLLDTMTGLQLRSTSDDLAQRVEATCYPTVFGATDTTVLYSLGSTSTLVASGEVNTALFGPYRDDTAVNSGSSQVGGMDFQPVTGGTDYTMNAAQDGGGTDLTGNFTVVASATAKGVAWTITNHGTAAGYITKLQLRGRTIYRTPTKVMAATNTFYGTRVVTFEMPYQSDLTAAQEAVTAEAALFARPGQARAAAVTFMASRDTDLSGLIFTEQGTRIALTETQTGLSLTEYLICGQKWELTPPRQCALTWYLEAVAMAGWITPAYGGGSFFGVSALGVLTGLWIVQAGDVVTYRYTLTNRTMTVAWEIDTTSVSSATPDFLAITIPEGRVSNLFLRTPCLGTDNGTIVSAYAQVNNGGTAILIGRGAAWSLSSNATTVAGEITFETTA